MFSRGSWSLGGRLYGWWQSIPKVLRGRLTINGSPVLEPDYSQMHAAILYAQRGLKLEGDAYETGDYPRQHGKVAFNVGLNARTPGGATMAIADALNVSPGYAAGS